MFRRSLAIFLLVLVSGAFLIASETPIPPAPRQYVTDKAAFLSPAAANELSRRLGEYAQQTGHQILVYIDQTTGDAPLDDWAVRAFKQWKPGRQGMDDGLVLFIMAQDRKLRIEVGYGLEGQVPDALAARIINEVITPRIRSGDPDGAVSSGIEAVAAAIGGQGLPNVQQQRRGTRGRESRPLTLGQLILFGIIGLVVLIIFVTNPSLAIYLLMSVFSGSGRRGGGGDWGGGGGGGFSGGGGRSGGGGASGSW